MQEGAGIALETHHGRCIPRAVVETRDPCLPAFGVGRSIRSGWTRSSGGIWILRLGAVGLEVTRFATVVALSLLRLRSGTWLPLRPAFRVWCL